MAQRLISPVGTNPLAAILSAALLVRHQWGLEDAAGRIEIAVKRPLILVGRQAMPTKKVLDSIVAQLNRGD